MMMKKSLVLLSIYSIFCVSYADTFPPIETPDDVQKALSFLTADTDSVGFVYTATAGELNNLELPLSYYSTADYWAKYVGTLPGNDLTVIDMYNAGNYTLTPLFNDPTSPGSLLQTERVNVYSGTDIYDAACWQIALALCGKNSLSNPSGGSLFDMANNQTQLLELGYDGNASQVTPGANRALTNGDTFVYNSMNITNPPNAYFFRMITRSWLSKDPFFGTSYMQYITAKNLPQNPDYQAGMITWLDWKPITGENAWAFLLGALHAAYLQQITNKETFIPFSSTAVQNALNVLLALRAMQSPLGGLYYACKGSLGNQGDQPVNPHEISVENNASTLAGLQLLKSTLKNELSFEQDLTGEQKSLIQTNLDAIDAMLFGGTTPQGGQTQGLLSFFKTSAWDAQNKIFYQGGLANDPAQPQTWMPTVEPKAVDVNTWGISVLGQTLIDEWFGFGSAYTIWQEVKSWGGFFGPDKELWGVGYSDQDGNGPSKDPKSGIMSAEWSAGAINMVRCLITQYKEVASSSSDHAKEAQTYVDALQIDHDQMCSHFLDLRSDNYTTSSAFSSVAPPSYNSLVPIPSSKQAFLYASRRYMIPFGWFANPLPSTTSTSWALMLQFSYNPFHPEGLYEANTFVKG